jgi:4-diphosphocytidyl-2-C-methyl-D-erythritol kinase
MERTTPARAIDLPAPAKLNLYLRVTGRRPDGYHLLETAFQFIDLCDELSISVREDGQILRSGTPGLPEDDLCLRAARALREAGGEGASGLGADIHLKKHIPIGAGLGGGSSDAAAVLLGLDRLWGTDLGIDALAEIGATLGADVPVFVHGRAAWASGVGEELEATDSFPETNYLLLDPGVAVSTRSIFEAPELTRDSPATRIRAPWSSGGSSGGSSEAVNDCLPVVEARFPEVASARAWLSRYGDARMTGTGAALFLAVRGRDEAEDIRGRVPEPWRAWVVEGLNSSPLHTAIAAEFEPVGA